MHGIEVPLPVGPWPQGLNVRDEADIMDGAHASELINLDVENDGTLTPRRPFVTVPSGGSFDGGNIIYVGSYKWGDFNYGIFWDYPNQKLYYKSNSTAPDAAVLALTFSLTNWNPFTCFVYGSQLYLVMNNSTSVVTVPLSANGAPTGGGPTTHTNVMPISNGVWYYIGTIKNRVFLIALGGFGGVTPNGRVYYSKATDPLTWTAPDGGFFDVTSPGLVNCWALVFNTIYIFKSTETFIFSFNSDPTLDGVLSRLHPILGADACCVYQNSIYLYNKEGVFLLQNNNFHRISSLIDRYLRVRRNVNFYIGGPGIGNYTLNVLDKTLLLGLPSNPNTGGSTSFFAMNIETGAWSEYQYKGSFISTDTITPVGPAAQVGSTIGDILVFLVSTSTKTAFMYIPAIKDRTTYKVDTWYSTSTFQYYVPNYSIVSRIISDVYNSRLRRFFPSPTTWKRMKYSALQGEWDLPGGVYTVQMDVWIDPIRDISIKGAIPYTATTDFSVTTNSNPSIVNRLVVRSFRYRRFMFKVSVAQAVYGSDPAPSAPHKGKPFHINHIICHSRPSREISV